MENASGVWTSKQLKKLEPVCKSWIRECRRFSAIADDACWWYNERASAGVLATAAARLKGWVALEEFSTWKAKITDKGVREEKAGRCDLWISNDETDFAIELKQAWQPIFSKGDALSSTMKMWESAWGDSGRLDKDEAMTRLAGVVVVPHFPTSKRSKYNREVRKNFLQELKNLRGVAALAWTFQADGKEYESESKSRLFPGAAIAFRLRYRQEKATR